MAVIIYGGMRYLTSAGNPSSVEEAKDAITSAVTGLILALLSWLILSTINPDILVLKSVGVNGGGTYSYADAKNSCVANATGTGTAANPCVCIDGKTVYAKSGAALVPTVLTLTVSPNPGSSTPPGNAITLSGKLTDTAGKPVSGSIKINKVNTGLNASTTFSETSDPSGNFKKSYTATCAVTDQIQAVYAGDATYAGSASTAVSLVINGMTICTIANYVSSPASASITGSGGGSACQSICSDTTLASDNAFHCLVAGVRIGWVPDTNVNAYTDAQLRAMATSTGTADSPYQAVEGGVYSIEMEKYSTVLNTPAVYRTDLNFDGKCDTSDPILNGTGGGWYKATATIISPPVAICKASQTPKGITCGQKFCVWDSKNNWAETTLYYTILAKP